ncbi:MAG: hypothetical protein II200_01705 [Bacteroidaceae bacterium]|nr:hypothetical protein [Bacteroidaceae bacterium]
MAKTTFDVVKTSSKVVKITSDVVFRTSDVVKNSLFFEQKIAELLAAKKKIKKNMFFYFELRILTVLSSKSSLFQSGF